MSLYKTPETESYLVDFPSGETKVFEVDRVRRDRESFAQYWLKKEKDFHAFQCRKKSIVGRLDRFGYENVRKDIVEKVNGISSIKRLMATGCPDLLVANDYGYMFVEVKSMEDGLRKSQLEWMMEYQDRFSIKIMYLE